MRLFAQPAPGDDLAQAPFLLLQKFPARLFTAETALEFAPASDGEQAGLVVMGQSHATLALRRTENGNQLVLQIERRARHSQ